MVNEKKFLKQREEYIEMLNSGEYYDDPKEIQQIMYDFLIDFDKEFEIYY